MGMSQTESSHPPHPSEVSVGPVLPVPIMVPVDAGHCAYGCPPQCLWVVTIVPMGDGHPQTRWRKPAGRVVWNVPLCTDLCTSGAALSAIPVTDRDTARPLHAK